jgi:hypothetical protein
MQETEMNYTKEPMTNTRYEDNYNMGYNTSPNLHHSLTQTKTLKGR